MFESIDFSRIPVFLSAAEHLSFTEAANELYMTQSSLSKSVASFEAAIGFPLFERRNRKVMLTPEGEYLYREFSRIMTETKNAIETANRMRCGLTGSFRIGVSGYLPQNTVFAELNSKFCTDYPTYDIDFCRMSYPEIRKALQDDKVDAILSNDQDIADMKDVHYLPISKGGAVLLCNANVELPILNRPLSVEDFKYHRFVCMKKESSKNYYGYLISCCKAYGFTPNIARFTESLPATIDYVTNLNYVTIVDRAIFPVDNLGLCAIPIEEKDGFTTLNNVLAWKHKESNQTFHRYIEYLSELLGTKEMQN